MNEIIDNTTLNNIIRKRTFWVELKAKKKEFYRIQLQINELEKAKKQINLDMKNSVDQFQLDSQEYDRIQYENRMTNE